MQMVPIAKVLRVKSVHLNEVIQCGHLGNVEKYLLEKGFEMAEKNSDGFFETWQSNKLNNENRNTLLFFDEEGNLMETKFAFVAPD